MAGAARKVAMMQVIGLHAVADQRAEQIGQRVGIGIDAAQKH